MAFSQNITMGQIREMVENPGQPVRQPAVSVLTVDTADRRIFDVDGFRVDSTSPNQIYINKQQTLMNGYITRVALTELNMEWNTPNVIASGACKNNTLLFERSDSATGVVLESRTITVDEGFYTPNELAAALTSACNNVGPGTGLFGTTNWEIVYNSPLQIAGFVIRFTGTFVPAFYWRIHPQNTNSSDDLCNLMGLTTPPKTFYKNLIGSYASMSYTPYFDIVSSQLTKKQNVNDQSTSVITGRNLLARIYLNNEGFVGRQDATTPAEPQANAQCDIVGCRPFSLYKEFQIPKQIYWDTKEFISVIDLTLIDYKGRVLYAKNQGTASAGGGIVAECGDSSEFQLTLQITET
jgi:hypothetical protein